MKRNSFLAVAVVMIFAIASCGRPEKKNVAERLVGVWTGIDTIRIAALDTTGTLHVETIAVPVAIEYFADTTLSGKVSYDDTTTARISAVVLVGEPYMTYSGMMHLNGVRQDVKGELRYQETPETLTMNFYTRNPFNGSEHTGRAVLTRTGRK